MPVTRPLALLALAASAACTAVGQPPAVVQQPQRDWRVAATGNDRSRLREWRPIFMRALQAARAAGHGAEIDREGVLLAPDAALGGGPIPAGEYRCRTVKLGAKSEGALNYVAYPAFRCRVSSAGPLQSFAKLSGSQRPVGLIYPGDHLRQVFLGTLVLGDEARAMRYGRDRERDVAGYVEKVGPRRWRLIMPRPHFESQMDVIELIPA